METEKNAARQAPALEVGAGTESGTPLPAVAAPLASQGLPEAAALSEEQLWDDYADGKLDCEAVLYATLKRYEADKLTIERQQERIRELEKQKRRMDDMLPLFEEARDAITAIPLASAKLRGLRLDLADRMDEVGIADNWTARDAARGAKEKE